jgi:hypothetical protein
MRQHARGTPSSPSFFRGVTPVGLRASVTRTLPVRPSLMRLSTDLDTRATSGR